jgi:hypothetical protein
LIWEPLSHQVETQIGRALLSGEIHDGATITLDAADGGLWCAGRTTHHPPSPSLSSQPPLSEDDERSPRYRPTRRDALVRRDDGVAVSPGALRSFRGLINDRAA